MNNNIDDDAIDHGEFYDSDLDDILEDLNDVSIIDTNDNDLESVEQTDDLVRIRFNASLNGYQRGDEVTVSADDMFFSGLIKQRLVEVL